MELSDASFRRMITGSQEAELEQEDRRPNLSSRAMVEHAMARMMRG